MNTYTKLANGEWAIRSLTTHNEGDVVLVSLKSGKTKEVTLGAFRHQVGEYFVYAVAPDAPKPAAQVGELSGIIALFDKAKAHLKYPTISIGEYRVSLAGPTAKVPGSLTITASTKNPDGSRDWFGRVLVDGTFQPSKRAPELLPQALRAFAANPARIASKYGKLNGKCCFCGIKLGAKDGNKTPSASALKSLAVGYGKDCAEHYGLPWGGTDARAAA